ncbi:hypothetical protein AAE478_005973 [Parahypoxylon ruwenzoriense]
MATAKKSRVIQARARFAREARKARKASLQRASAAAASAPPDISGSASPGISDQPTVASLETSLDDFGPFDDDPVTPTGTPALSRDAGGHTPSPIMPETRSSGTSRRARPDPAGLRDTPCMGCLRSALAGRSTGQCYDTVGNGSRCWRCASGHSCLPVPEGVTSMARNFVSARVSGDQQAIRKYAPLVRALLEDHGKKNGDSKEEEDESKSDVHDFNDTPRAGHHGLSPSERRRRIKEIISELSDLMAD